MITKKSLVAWDKVCMTKARGGLNLINLQLLNKAAIAKTCLDMAHRQDKLWLRWIHTYYIKSQQFSRFSILHQASWMIRKIIEARELLNEGQCNHADDKSIIR